MRRIADPDRQAGGAVAAGVSLANAAAAAELVAAVALRRARRHGRDTDALAGYLDELAKLSTAFLQGADADIAAFARVMAARRAAREAGPAPAGQEAREEVRAALELAARHPIELARHGLRLLEITGELLPHASRFTVSDLGAAAALARGAIEAALLTAAINLEMIDGSREELATLVAQTRQEADSLAELVIRATRATIQRAQPSTGEERRPRDSA